MTCAEICEDQGRSCVEREDGGQGAAFYANTECTGGAGTYEFGCTDVIDWSKAVAGLTLQPGIAIKCSCSPWD
jgi:hypothetical protein